MSVTKARRTRGRPPVKDIDVPTDRRIAEAALQEFATHGYEGAKISSIAERAGVVTPAVNYHYKSKLDLWKAAVSQSFTEYEELIASVQSDLVGLDPESVLRVMVRKYTSVAISNPARIRIVLMEGIRDNERSRWLVDNHLKRTHRVLMPFFDELIENGVVKEISVLTIISMLAGSVFALISNAKMLGDAYGIKKVTEDVILNMTNEIIEVMLNGMLSDDR